MEEERSLDDVDWYAFICPITHAVFREPCVAADGFMYERCAMAQWIAAATGGGRPARSPRTNLPLANLALLAAPAAFLADLERFAAAHPEEERFLEPADQRLRATPTAFRLNLAATQAYNADFDGDEMTIAGRYPGLTNIRPIAPERDPSLLMDRYPGVVRAVRELHAIAAADRAFIEEAAIADMDVEDLTAPLAHAPALAVRADYAAGVAWYEEGGIHHRDTRVPAVVFPPAASREWWWKQPQPALLPPDNGARVRNRITRRIDLGDKAASRAAQKTTEGIKGLKALPPDKEAAATVAAVHSLCAP